MARRLSRAGGERLGGQRERLAVRMRSHRTVARERMRQGAYLLPSLLTVGSIFLSFWAIIQIYNLGAADGAELSAARQNTFLLAAWLLFGAFICDGLDGKVARLTNTSSEFGIQLDSLADVISFGVAPALLVYSWALQPFGRAGWLVAFLFVSCGACRLARFNVQTTAAPDKRYFTGLPIPTAALTLGALVLNHPHVEPRSLMSYAMLVLVAVLAFLMVSRIPYRSFKDVDFRRKRHPSSVALIAVFLVVVALEPAITLLLGLYVFVVSGPIARVLPEQWRTIEAKASQRLEAIVAPQDEEAAPQRPRTIGSDEDAAAATAVAAEGPRLDAGSPDAAGVPSDAGEPQGQG